MLVGFALFSFAFGGLLAFKTHKGASGGTLSAKNTYGGVGKETNSASARDCKQDIDVEDGFEEVLRELRLLDEGIVAVLQRGDIRLLRTAWLLAQPNSKPLPNRQELEALEEQLTGEEVSPLLHPDEAVALIHCADRRVGVLSHGWLTAGHCDPCAARLAVVVQALAPIDNALRKLRDRRKWRDR